jgi:hypothetical protein
MIIFTVASDNILGSACSIYQSAFMPDQSDHDLEKCNHILNHFNPKLSSSNFEWPP